MIIDFHNHYYPPRYLKALQSGESAVKVTFNDQGHACIHYPGDYNIAVPGQIDLNIRRKMLDDQGIDMQVYTLTTPGTHVETPATAVKLASMVNDEFAEGIAAHPGRFTALATLPLERSGCVGEGVGSRDAAAQAARGDAVQQCESCRVGG